MELTASERLTAAKALRPRQNKTPKRATDTATPANTPAPKSTSTAVSATVVPMAASTPSGAWSQAKAPQPATAGPAPVSKALQKNIDGAGPKAVVAAVAPQGTWGEKKPLVAPTPTTISPQQVAQKAQLIAAKIVQESPKPKKVKQSKQEGWTKVEVGKVRMTCPACHALSIMLNLPTLAILL
jgi:hypothetical protein